MFKKIRESLLCQLICNRIFISIMFISFSISFFVSGDKWTEEGFKLIPQVIGVIWSGLVATVAIIFTLLKEEDLINLNQRNKKFTGALLNLKNHIITILVVLVLSIFAFFIEFSFVTQLLNYWNTPILNVFYFTEIFLLLFGVYSAYEVIQSLFLVFEIKIRLLEKDSDKYPE